MKRPIPTIHQSSEELKRLLKTQKDVRKRQRVEMLYLLQSGQAKTRLQGAALLGVHRQSVAAWLEAYERGGMEALLTIGTPPGKPSRLSPEVWEALQARLAQPQGFASYGQIQKYREEEHQVQLAYSTVHALVRYKLKAKPKTPRPSHKKKDPEQVEAFVRTFAAQVAEAKAAAPPPREGAFQRVRLFAGEESRLGLLPILRHRITLKGVQPIAPVAHRFDFLYLYGAGEPLTGESFFLECPALNALYFEVFLHQLARAYPDDLLLVTVDNSQAHKAACLTIPPNVRLLFFPPYAPEVNPIERLWRAIKDVLADARPDTLEELSALVTTILKGYAPQDIQALTSYSYFVQAA